MSATRSLCADFQEGKTVPGSCLEDVQLAYNLETYTDTDYAHKADGAAAGVEFCCRGFDLVFHTVCCSVYNSSQLESGCWECWELTAP